MANKRLMLDAGHGANTPGRRTIPKGTTEWRLNQNVANFVVEMLRGYNVDIRFANDTTGATDVALGTRVTRTRDFNPHLFVSIHHNAFNGVLGTHTGTEVFTNVNFSANSNRFAQMVAPRLATNTGLRNRGIKRTNWAVLGLPASIPAILAEGGFMDSSIDVPVIESTNGQRAYAKALADSIIEFLGLKKTNATNNNNGQTVHIVQSGENLTRIANQYGVTVNAIVQANSLKNPNVVNVGQRLIIPASSGGTSNNNNTSNNTHVLKSATSGFTTAADALANRNPRTTVKAGTYHVFNTSQGMINVTTKQGTAGSWINPNATTTPTPTQSFFPKTPTRNNSLQDTLNHIGADGSFNGRLAIARANGISDYSGTAAQNNQMLSLLNNGRLVRP